MGYSNLIGVVAISAVGGVLVAAYGDMLTGYVIFHIAVAAFLLVSTESRGVIADVLFAVFWPIYVIVDWKAGRL